MNPISRMLAWVLIAPIRVYRRFLSPLLPQMCRFHPSCSVYAMGALHMHGPIRGSWLAVRRISRCHPFNPGGFDPVPEIKKTGARTSIAVDDVKISVRPEQSASAAEGHRPLSKSSSPLTPSSLV